MRKEWLAASEEESDAAGREIAAMLPASGVVYFNGDLGAGKTHLIRAIAEARGAERDEVSSPTFAIVHEYPLENGSRIVHLDCYRLSDHQREWEEIGIPDLLTSAELVLVEWPKERFDRYVKPRATVTITLDDAGRRRIELSAPA